MRLTVLAVGSQGDVRPFTALGAGLARAGHNVRMATHDTFQGIVRSAGLEFARIGVNPLEIVQGKTGQAWLASMDNPIRFMSNVARLARDVLDSLNDDAWAACQGSDAIIYSLPLSLSGHTMADSLGVPGIPGALYPLHPTRAFPSIMTPRLPLHAGAVNWLSGRVVVQVFWQVFRSQQNRWRKSRLGLPPHSLRPPLASWRKNGVPVLYGYSPSVVPPAGDWDPTCAVCGYWFSPTESWSPSAALSDFLAAGPMPLYIGFGSMASANPSRMTAIVLEALRRTGHRAILASGWGGLRDEALPETVLPVESVPHEWLFPRVAAAVHHGGAGTAAAALRVGIPSIVVPFFADQFFWGMRLCQLGVAPPPIPQKKLSVQGLVQAIQSVTGTASYAKGAKMLSEKIAAERGVDAAVGVVDGYLRSTIRHRIQ